MDGNLGKTIEMLFEFRSLEKRSVNGGCGRAHGYHYHAKARRLLFGPHLGGPLLRRPRVNLLGAWRDHGRNVSEAPLSSVELFESRL